MSRSDSLGMVGEVQITIILVIKSDSDNDRRTLRIGGNTSGSFTVLTGLDDVGFAHQNGFILTNYTMTSSPTILVIIRDGSAAHGDSVGGDKLYANGVAQTNVANSSTNKLGFIDTAFDIGAQDSVGTNPYDGAVGEVIVYDRILSTFEREQIEEYLSKKWKIKLSG